ncbi:MOS1T transposase, partial [Pseudoatta argentina]
MSYAEILRTARERIDVEKIGIKEIRPRKARTGAFLLEIPGPAGAAQADSLATKLREVLADKDGVRISRPVKTAEIRIRDIEDSVSQQEVASVVAKEGGCNADDIKVGPIKRAPNGLGTVWAKCPLVAAIKVARLRKIRMGWTSTRIELLPDRPLQCYRCLEKGHVRAECRSEIDRTLSCYRCGSHGHRAIECDGSVNCPLCADAGLPSSHRIGGKATTIPRISRNEERMERPGRMTMPNRLLQANLNHARVAQDLILQTMAERDCGLAVISEPYRVPVNHPHWMGDKLGSVAITWRQTRESLPCTPIEAGEGYVAVKWGDMRIIGTYISPSFDVSRFEERLELLEACLGRLAGGPIILAGDFNAKSPLWGPARIDVKGRLLEEWATAVGLCCLNQGGANTLTHSDHLYIEIAKRAQTRPQRWSLKQLDEDILEAAVLAGLWTTTGAEKDLDGRAAETQSMLVRACDMAMPRATQRPKKAMYWWSDSIATLRHAAMRARRRMKRARRGQSDPEEIEAREARINANEAVNSVVQEIQALDLRVAPQKSEAIFFHGGKRGRLPKIELAVAGVSIPVKTSIKYLGLVIDSRWNFQEHFRQLTPRLERMAMSLSGLLPNVGGPGGKVRGLFNNVVQSMVLYAAPVWAEEARKGKVIQRILHASQRRLATRMIRAYRTISFAAATTLAGVPPLELVADMHAEVFDSVREVRSRERITQVPAKEINLIKHRARLKLINSWREWLTKSGHTGVDIVNAIRPRLQEWVDARGGISFHVAQISPDIAPSDFHLFRSMAHGLADRRFHSYEEAQKWIDSWIASKDMSFFRRGIHVLPERWEKVVSSDGQYFK